MHGRGRGRSIQSGSETENQRNQRKRLKPQNPQNHENHENQKMSKMSGNSTKLQAHLSMQFQITGSTSAMRLLQRLQAETWLAEAGVMMNIMLRVKKKHWSV
jgi:hypothetical protein